MFDSCVFVVFFRWYEGFFFVVFEVFLVGFLVLVLDFGGFCELVGVLGK